MSNDNISSRTDETKNTWQKKIKMKMKIENSNVAETKENDKITLDSNRETNKPKKMMRIERRGVNMEEYNRLKRGNYNNYNRNSDVSRSSTAASLEYLSSVSESQVDTEKNKIRSSNAGTVVAPDSLSKKKLSFKNKLVNSLYKKFNRKCSLQEALDFFKSDDVSANDFDVDFWKEILYCIDLDPTGITITNLISFEKNILELIEGKKANKEKSIIMSVLSSVISGFSSDQQPKEIKFGISPDILKKLLTNEKVKFCKIRDKICEHFYIRTKSDELSDSMFNVIFGGISDDRIDGSQLFDILQSYCTLTGTKEISVTVSTYKNIFRKISWLSIKDYVQISGILEVQKEVEDFDFKKEYIFNKFDSCNDTQKDVENFIDDFAWDDIKTGGLKDRLYCLELFVSCFPKDKLTFEFVINFAKDNLGLELSDLNLNIEILIELLSKVKSSSVDFDKLKNLVEIVKGKNIFLVTKNQVGELRRLLCEVLRISGKGIGLSNVMDLFLLYPEAEMPKLCNESTLTNESLKFALENIDMVSPNNQNLDGDKNEFRSKLKNFVGLFKDGSNKITFDSFKNLISVVPDDCLDFDCINALLEKTGMEKHQNDLFSFFENTLLKKISQYKFDLSKVRVFFDSYLSGDAVKNNKFKPDTFESIIKDVIKSNKDCSCENENIKWLLKKCCEFGVKLEKDQFIDLIKKGKENSRQIKVEKIKWSDMYDFINKIVSPESGFFSSEKITFDGNEISAIHTRSNFGFDSDNLNIFVNNITTLKKVVTDENELLRIALSHMPYDSLPNLDVFRKVVYYCFEDVKSYNSDKLNAVDYCHKIDLGLYNELLKTFADGSLSFEDFQKLDKCYFGKNESGMILDFIFNIFSRNNDQNKIIVDPKILRKKLKRGCLTKDQIKTLFRKVKDKELSKDDFIEFLMLAEDNALNVDEFIDLFKNYCKDRIETENNDDMLNKIADKISNANKETLRDHLVKLNVEKGIRQLLDDINKDFSVLFRLHDEKLKDYGLGTLLNQGKQENGRQNNDPGNAVDAGVRLNQDPLSNQNNGEVNLDNVVRNIQDMAVKIVKNLDEGKYGSKISVINFKAEHSDFWGDLSNKERIIIQMMLGYTRSSLLPISCLILCCLLFVAATTITYCLGVFFIVYFLLELIGVRTRNRLTEIVQGQSREPSFWDRFLVWNECIENVRTLYMPENGNPNKNNNFYKEVEDSVFSVMVPEYVPFFSTAASVKNTALRMINRVSSIFNRNVL